jgi:hypothetical protein
MEVNETRREEGAEIQQTKIIKKVFQLWKTSADKGYSLYQRRTGFLLKCEE